MKEFQEENLFQGAAQSQGFAPMQAPDTSRFLRENMAQVDQNFANLQSQQQAALDAKLQKQLKTLEVFGQFSTKAMEFAQTMGKAYIDSQIIEGQNKTRSLGKALSYGISAEQEQQFNQTLNEEKQNQAVAADAAIELSKQNAPIEALNYIKSLPHYQRIGAYRSYYANKGKVYGEFLTNFVQRSDIRLPKPANMGGGTFTPQEIDDDPVLMQIALSHASRLFMAQEVGIGADNNPTALAAKPLYEEMDKAEDDFMRVIRRNKSINDSEKMVFQATETYKANGDINAYISALTGSVDNEGRVRSRSDALDYLFDDIIRQYEGDNPEPYNQLKVQAVEGDPQGKTFWQRFENRIKGPKGLEAQIDAIDRRKRALEDERETEELKGIRRNFEAIVRDRAQRGEPPFTEGQIDLMLKADMDKTGKGPEYFPWYERYITQEKQDSKKEEEFLLQIRRDRGYLIESDLRNVSQTTYNNFLSRVQEDKTKAELPKNYASDANRLINSLTDQHFEITQGDAPKTPEWEDMARRARDKYSMYINENIDAGMDPYKAQQEALKRIRENFSAGTYTRDPATSPNTQYLKKLSSARLTMSQRPDLDKYVIANTQNEIQQLVAYTKGQAEIPKLYFDLAKNQRNLTAWDIAAAQFRAAGYGKLSKSPKQKAVDALDPDVQAVIRYKPNQNRLRRAQTGSFNTQTSSLTNPILKRAADIVSNYESAGSGGYNAVNQGGEAGGTKIPAGFYSGDFRKMPQHGGRDLTSLTIGEIMDLQADPGGRRMSNAEWVRQGKLHAVGRYQFIGSTLKGLVQRLGIPRNAKFTPELQDRLFLSLLKSGGLGQWVGPARYATAEEKALINQARAQL